MNDNEIVSQWRRLEAWATANSPEMLSGLDAPATMGQIEALEAELGANLPADFRASLEVHDGEVGEARLWLRGGLLLSLREISNVWRMEGGTTESRIDNLSPADDEEFVFDGPVKAYYHNPRWIPFMQLEGIRTWYLDLDPAPGGAVGQVITVDPDAGRWCVVATSFSDLLSDYVDQLEEGKASPDGDATSGSGDARAEIERMEGRGAALAASMSYEDLLAVSEGSEVQIVGSMRRSAGSGRYWFAVRGGEVLVEGSLSSAGPLTTSKLQIRVGAKRWFGLRSAVHEIISCETV